MPASSGGTGTSIVLKPRPSTHTAPPRGRGFTELLSAGLLQHGQEHTRLRSSDLQRPAPRNLSLSVSSLLLPAGLRDHVSDTFLGVSAWLSLSWQGFFGPRSLQGLCIWDLFGPGFSSTSLC